jgi:hypothetical protein
VVQAEESTRNWTRQLITLDAGYGDERMHFYLYLPLAGAPPYQTVVLWTGAQGVFLDAYEKTNFGLDFLVRNGRAVAVPVFSEILNAADVAGECCPNATPRHFGT